MPITESPCTIVPWKFFCIIDLLWATMYYLRFTQTWMKTLIMEKTFYENDKGSSINHVRTKGRRKSLQYISIAYYMQRNVYVCVYVCVSVCVCVSVYLSVCLSLCLSVHVIKSRIICTRARGASASGLFRLATN